MVRELAIQRNIAHDSFLVIGDQALLDGTEIDKQRLPCLQKVRLDESRRGLVADAGCAVATNLCHPHHQVQLFRVAQQIAVLPSRGEAAAQVCGIGSANVGDPFWTLDEFKGERQSALIVQMFCCMDMDRRENANRSQVLAGFFDGFGVERITLKNTQATAHKRLVHGNQSVQRNFAQRRNRACCHLITDIKSVGIGY